VSLFFDKFLGGLQDCLADVGGTRGAGLDKSESVKVSKDCGVVESDCVFFFGEKKYRILYHSIFNAN
jgi:hypothetical protein